MSGLIDTTEMYLRTILELEEEGVVPMRARIAERLEQSGPTVSQTVARMERDGLVTVEGDRHLQLTDEGMRLATRVMRKHRLAECLLVDVIGLEWEQVHAEACRWEHVMSEAVERRVVELLRHPTESPYGNPIPGLEELGEQPRGLGDRGPLGVPHLRQEAHGGVEVVVCGPAPGPAAGLAHGRSQHHSRMPGPVVGGMRQNWGRATARLIEGHACPD
jgi:DtxR family Mn-dependent transcriptional regulator